MKKDGRKRRRSFKSHSRAAHDGTTEDLAAQLAPLEEQSASRVAQTDANNNGGAIVVDTGALRLPEGFAEEKERNGRLWGMEPVVFWIILLALAFIAFVAWQITRMPAKNEESPPAPLERKG